MSLEDFLVSPWLRSHHAYEGSSFNIRPAPEFATGEVVLASTYRAAGFPGLSEGQVPSLGRELDRASKKATKPRGVAPRISSDTWRTILLGALQSPKQPNQSAKRFVQLCPVVPDTALYSGSARLSGNSWNPGQLVALMVELGSPSRGEAQKLWSALQSALEVGADDDLWARWLQSEFEARSVAKRVWSRSDLESACRWPAEERAEVRLPARQFARDLAAVLQAKRSMTRRQWVSLLEAVLRLGSVAHVLWLCDVNDRLWRAARAVLAGGQAPNASAVAANIVDNSNTYLVYGAPALPIVRDLASRYLGARLGINLVLHELASHGHDVEALASMSDIVIFLQAVESRRQQLQSADLDGQLGELRDRHARTIACKRGIGSNLAEFCRHTLGQRKTADDNLRGYDQGYQLKQKASYATAPWIVSLGPVALLALVHCCLAEAAGPRSVQRLCEHLAWYGVDVDPDDFAKGELGRSLRMLGLVLDSPDAESGMLLVPPFEIAPASAETTTVD